MQTFRAHVRGGRLTLDEPTALAEGSEIDLVHDDGALDLGQEALDELRLVLSQGIEEARRGGGVSVREALAELEAVERAELRRE
jgi:hypothetical protein